MSADALAVRLLAIFVEELDEQVVQMGSDLTALGRTPGDAERLRSIFRVMHTLKGASRAAGVPLIEQLCHVLESGLAHAKERATPLSADQHALLVESAMTLREALGDKLFDDYNLFRDRVDAVLKKAGLKLPAADRARGFPSRIYDHLRARFARDGAGRRGDGRERARSAALAGGEEFLEQGVGHLVEKFTVQS